MIGNGLKGNTSYVPLVCFSVSRDKLNMFGKKRRPGGDILILLVSLKAIDFLWVSVPFYPND